METGAEERLAARGLPIAEWDMTTVPNWPEGDDYLGILILTPFGADRQMGAETTCYVRQGLAPEDRAAFATWIETRIEAYFEVGPEADGWTERSDGGWQLICRVVRLPDMSFLD